MSAPPKRLVDLEPRWLSSGGEGITDKNGNPVPERSKIGIMFRCPICPREANCRIPVLFENPPDGLGPLPGGGTTWRIVGGTTFDDLQLRPSILMLSGCKWHGHVGLNKPGEVTTC